MTKRNLRFIIFFIFFILSFISTATCSYAAFNLTVLSSEGGTDIHFEQLAPGDFKENMQMTLTINSTIGKQYRVIQQIINPLATMEGDELPSDQFRMYTLVNSNARGTLIYREEMPVDRFDTVLYTSDSAGTNDSFQLVYTLEPVERQTAGKYYGTIAYVLEPMDSTESQVVVTVKVYAELEAGTIPVVDIQTNSISSRLVLDSENIDRKDGYEIKDCPQVDLKIVGPLRKKYSIYQSFEGGIVHSASGQEFDLSQVLFVVEGGDKGIVAREGSLKQASDKQLIYTSDLNGSGDELTITYKPAKGFRLLPAGHYRGRLSFSIESGLVTEKIKTLDFEFNVVRVFDMYIYSNGQEGFSLNFGQASFKDGVQRSVTEIYVESNLYEPYQIAQIVDRPMANEKGDELPLGDFTMCIKDVKGAQEPRFYVKEATPVRQGNNVIFSSGPKGQSSSFTVEYYLKLKPDTKGGNYSTNIGYSLVQS
ncbi:MAG: hypothetical protein ABIC68_03910 [Candidatus Omnitrophota bacterium]